MRSIIFFFIFFFQSSFLNSIEIKNVATVNNSSITNYDVIKRVALLEKIQNKKILVEDYYLIIQNLIDEKVKEIEIENNKIKIDMQIVKEQFNKKYPNFNKNQFDNKIKDFLIKKTQIDLQWNVLLNKKFYNKLAVNLSEINEVMKSRNISNDKKEDFILLEKNKKLVSISNNYFNLIKSKTYIEIFNE